MDDYKIYFDFGSGWEEVEIDIATLVKTEIGYKGLKAQDSSVKFDLISNNTLYNKLRGISASNLPCRITKNTDDWFYGYLRKDFEFIETRKVKNVSIEIVSPSYYLKRKIGKDLYYYQSSVSTIISNLLTMAIGSGFSIPTISAVIPAWACAYDDDKTYHDVIFNMLWEYGYGFRFDDSGSLYTFPLRPASLMPVYTFDKNLNTIGEIRQSNKEETYQETIINWTGTRTLTNAVIFADTSGGDAINDCNIEIEPHGYYEVEEGIVSFYADYKHDEGDILATDGITLDMTADSDIEAVIFDAGSDSAKISIYNNNAYYPKKITRLQIKAATCIISSGDKQTKVVKVDDTDKIFSYDAEYIYDKTTAGTLANALAWYYGNTDYAYSLTSKDDVPLNSIVSIIATGSIVARIVAKTYNVYDDVIGYDLEAVGDYVAETPTTIVSSVPTAVALAQLKAKSLTSFYEVRYCRSDTQPATPTTLNPDGWTVDIPSEPYESPVWMTGCTKTTEALITSWYAPIRFTNAATIYTQLTNDSAIIPCDAEGNNGDYSACQSRLIIYQGTTDTTSQYVLGVIPSSESITYTFVDGLLSITDMTIDSGFVDLIGTLNGNTVSKRFTLAKQKSSEPTTLYDLQASNVVILIKPDDVYEPSSVVFNSYSREGTGEPVAYSGIYYFYVNDVLIQKSASPISTYTWTGFDPLYPDEYRLPSDGLILVGSLNSTSFLQSLKVEVWDETETYLRDKQTISLISDWTNYRDDIKDYVGAGKYLGRFNASLPSSYIKNDYWLIYDTDNVPYIRGVYYYNGTTHTRITGTEADSGAMIAAALPDILWSVKNGYGTVADYGAITYIQYLVADSAFIDALSVVDLTIRGSISVDDEYVYRGVFNADRFYPRSFY